MKKYKFKKGDWVIMTRDDMYVKNGTIVQIMENCSNIPYTNYDITSVSGLGKPISELNAELIGFKEYLKLL